MEHLTTVNMDRKTTLRQTTAIPVGDSKPRQLSDEEIYRHNPHCIQWKRYPGSSIPRFDKLILDLNDVEPTFTYRKLTHTSLSILHWGQRKLFLSELDFLTRFYSEGDTMLYVGAAPGTHLKLIAELFPSLKFILYDGRDFDSDLYDNPNFEIRQMYFTDLEALRFVDTARNTLFVSDIRGDIAEEHDDIKQLKVSYDMKDQERWYEIINAGRGDQYPKKALFKFRLPHATENLSKESMETGKNLALAPGSNLFSYLDGELRIQAYPRQGSAEMRLIPNGKKRLWDVRIHDNKAMTHNVLRAGYYEHEEVEGCDHCFDCSFEIYIWQNYIKKYGKTEPVRHYVNLLNSKLANGKFTPLTYRSKGD